MERTNLTNILEDALAAVTGPRAEAYGPPIDNWARTVAIFNAMTGQSLTPEQGVKFAIAMKLARLYQTPNHMDSWVDLAGYAWVGSEVVDK